jgi:hypothetical protein
MTLVGDKVRRESRWTPAGATPARELVRSTQWESEQEQGSTSFSVFKLQFRLPVRTGVLV